MASSVSNTHTKNGSSLGSAGIRREIINFFNTTSENIENWYAEYELVRDGAGSVDLSGLSASVSRIEDFLRILSSTYTLTDPSGNQIVFE